jgi:single-strand DNA-binding protein
MAEYRVPNINSISITGNLTADPDLRYMPDGRAVCNFQIASNRRYKDKAGEWQDATTFVRVTTWGPSAERLGEQLRKGSAIFAEGRIQSRSWETPEGQKKSIVEINALRVQNLTKQVGAGGAGEKEESVEKKEARPDQKEGLPF